MMILQQTRGALSSGDQCSLDLPFAATKSLTARIGPTPIFTRASIATFIGSNGLIQTAAAGAARFDHDPLTLACKGLLIEESRANLLTNSNFVGWNTASGAHTVTFNSTDVGVAPDGSYPTKIECTVTGNLQLGIPVISGVAYNNSVYARSLSGGVTIRIGGIIPGATTAFNTTNQFVRYSHVNTAATTTTRFFLFTMIAGEIIYVWGAQAEAGSFPTSYIPTTTASVIRGSDVCSITGSDFTSFIKTGEGSVIVHGDSYQGIAPTFCFFDNDTGGAISFYFRRNSSTGALEHFDGAAGGSTIAASPSFPVKFGVFRSQELLAGVRLRTFYNGANSPGLSAFTVSAVQTRMLIGNSNTNTRLNGCIRSIKYFKKRLPDSKMRALTAT